MRVLLIEDEPTTAKSIELMLGTEGFNVYTTDLGEEGLDLLRPEEDGRVVEHLHLLVSGVYIQGGLSRALTLATVAHVTKAMKPRLAKNLTGMAGYSSLAYASQRKRRISRTAPMRMVEITAADCQG